MKLDDLTIFLKAQDKTKGAFSKVSKRIEKMNGLSKLLTKGLIAVGAAFVSSFSAAVVNGAALNKELQRMSNSIGTTTKEADELYKIVRAGAPTTNLDNLGEGILTLKEGFFDARAESGPLFDLIKDFGADIDIGLESPREQLLAFLKAMREIESPTIRAGAAVANFGGEDAKAIITITNNMDTLNETIERLQGTANEGLNFITFEDIAAMNAAQEAATGLSNAWDDFSTSAFAFAGPALKFLTEKTEAFVKLQTKLIGKYKEIIGIFRDPIFLDPSSAKEASKQLEEINDKVIALATTRNELIERGAKDAPRFSILGVRFSTLEKQLTKAQGLQLKTFKSLGKLRKEEEVQAKIDQEAEDERKRLAAIEAANKIAAASAKALRKRFESESKSLENKNVLEILGISDLDLGEAINKIDSLPKLQDRELLRIAGLDLDETQKESLAEAIAVDFNLVQREAQRRILELTDAQNLRGGTVTLDSVVDGLAANDNDFALQQQKDFNAELEMTARKTAAVQSVMSSASAAVGTLASTFAKTKSQARAFIAIQQTLAVVSAYSAATQSLADITKPTAFEKFAAYSAVLAQGLAGVAAIKNAGKSIGAGGGGSTAEPTVSAPATRFTPPQQQDAQGSNRPTRVINLTIQGNQGFTADQLEDFVDLLNDTDGLEIRRDRVAA